jgi:hypothetical protein
VTAESHVGAEILIAGAAFVAAAAGVGGLDDDALARSRAGLDRATHLVTQHQRVRDDIFADAAILVPVQV